MKKVLFGNFGKEENYNFSNPQKILSWHDIHWNSIQKSVEYMQQQIMVAYQEKDQERVKELQWKLVKSYEACCMAVKKVSSNPGSKTPGGDGIIWEKPGDRQIRAQQLYYLDWDQYKAYPAKRVWIPKSNGKKRPLGIPSMFDRAVQTVWSFAQQPIAECSGDRNSYGYRPQRSAKDAMQALFLRQGQRYGPFYVLERDIEGFFDNLNHEWMLKHLPMNDQILKRWLKAGIVEKGNFQRTEAGVPQGGPISPILANMCLDGQEQCVLEAIVEKKCKTWSPKVTTVRYADDFVITGATKRQLVFRIKPAVQKFLKVRGLRLHPDKTHITDVRNGFDFLGYNYKLYPSRDNSRGFKFLIKPSKKSILKLKVSLRETFQKSKNWSADFLICTLNPILRGWRNYFNCVVTSKIFHAIDRYQWKKVWKWIKKKEIGKGRSGQKTMKRKYFKKRRWLELGVSL